MDYEKKYRDLVEAVKELQEANPSDEGIQKWVVDNVPELKESEDEKIRRDIVFYIAAHHKDDGEKARWLYWLEKQGKQKPADLKTKAGNWYICDMDVMNENMITAFHRDEIYYCPKDGYLDVCGALFEVGCIDVFRLATEKEIPQPQQKPAWSEEDDYNLQCMIAKVTSDIQKGNIGRNNELIDWLKSLRPQNTWKPSDEQMEALRKAEATIGVNHVVLAGLISDLEKLK